ncbi:MAG: TetR/AcrR family transcriptional regulator [Saprospiraceae bacterium]
MGVTERKEREKAELKELILNASKKLLLKYGQDGLSIRKIAKAIEYSPATLYLYYKDKDEIMHELMEVGFSVMGKYMMESYQEPNPAKRIHMIGTAYIKFGMENKYWYDLMFNSDKQMKLIEKCREEWDQGMQMFDYLANTCQEAILHLGMKDVEPRILALHLWSAVHGLINLAQGERLDIVEVNQVDTLLQRTLDSVFKTVFKE